VRALVADDYPIGLSRETVEEFLDLIATGWGTKEFAVAVSPSRSRVAATAGVAQ